MCVFCNNTVITLTYFSKYNFSPFSVSWHLGWIQTLEKLVRAMGQAVVVQVEKCTVGGRSQYVKFLLCLKKQWEQSIHPLLLGSTMDWYQRTVFVAAPLTYTTDYCLYAGSNLNGSKHTSLRSILCLLI